MALLPEEDAMEQPQPGEIPRPVPATDFAAQMQGEPLPGETGEAFLSRREKLGQQGVLGPTNLPADAQEAQQSQKIANNTRDTLVREQQAAQNEADRVAAADARVKEQQQRRAEADTRRAAAVQERAAVTAQRQQVKALKAQGVTMDLGADGVETPAKHGDGRIKFKAEFTGDPYYDEQQGRYVRDYRDQFGESKPVDMEANGDIHTDAKTGLRYLRGADGLRIELGPDANFDKRNETRAKLDELSNTHALAAADIAEKKLAGVPLKEAWDEQRVGNRKLVKDLEDAKRGMEQTQAMGEVPQMLKDHGAKLQAQWDAVKPAYDAAKAAYEAHAKEVLALETQNIERKKASLKAGADLERLKTAPLLPQGQAKPLSVQVQEAATAAQDELTTAEQAHREAVGAINQAGKVPMRAEAGAAFNDKAKAALSTTETAVKEAAAKVVHFQKLGSDTEQAAATVEQTQAEVAPKVEAITRERQMIFAKQVDGAISREAAQKRLGELDQAHAAAVAPLASAAQAHRAAAEKMANAFTPEWEMSPEHAVALGDVEKLAVEHAASGAGTVQDGTVKALESAKAAGAQSVDGADIDEQLTKLRAGLAAKGEGKKTQLWDAVAGAVDIALGERKAGKDAVAAYEKATNDAASALIASREAGKKGSSFHYDFWGDHSIAPGQFRFQKSPDDSAVVFVWDAALQRMRETMQDPNIGSLGKFTLGALEYAGGLAASAKVAILGTTVSDVLRQQDATNAYNLIGNLDVGGTKEMLGHYAALNSKWEKQATVLTDAQRESFYEQEKNGMLPSAGYKDMGVLGVNWKYTLAGAEQQILALENDAPGVEGAVTKMEFFSKALGKALPILKTGGIQIDESDPLQVAQRAFLRDKLEQTIHEKSPNFDIAGQAVGSLAGFMAAGYVGAKLGGLAKSEAAASAVKTGTTGGIMGLDQSFKETPNSIGAMNRTVDAGVKGAVLMWTEALGDAGGEKLEHLLAGFKKTPSWLPKWAPRAVGKGAGVMVGEDISDLGQNMIDGKAPLDEFETTAWVNGALGLGSFIAHAMGASFADARVRKIGGKPTAGAFEGAVARHVEALAALDAARQQGDAAGMASAADAVRAATTGLSTTAAVTLAVSPRTQRAIAGILGAETRSLQTGLEENEHLRLAGVALGREMRDLYLPGAKWMAAQKAARAEVDFGGEAGGLADAVVDQHVGALAARELADVAQNGKLLAPEKLAALSRLGLVADGPDGKAAVTDDAIPFLPAAMRKAMEVSPEKFRVVVTPGNDGAMANQLREQGVQIVAGASKRVTAQQAAAVAAALQPAPTTSTSSTTTASKTQGAQWKVTVEGVHPKRGKLTASYTISAATAADAEAVARQRIAKTGDGRTITAVRAEPVGVDVATASDADRAAAREGEAGVAAESEPKPEQTDESGAKFVLVTGKSGNQKKQWTETIKGSRVGDVFDAGMYVNVVTYSDNSSKGMPGEYTITEISEILGPNDIVTKKRDMTPEEITKKRKKLQDDNEVMRELGMQQEAIPEVPNSPAKAKSEPAATISKSNVEGASAKGAKEKDSAQAGVVVSPGGVSVPGAGERAGQVLTPATSAPDLRPQWVKDRLAEKATPKVEPSKSVQSPDTLASKLAAMVQKLVGETLSSGQLAKTLGAMRVRVDGNSAAGSGWVHAKYVEQNGEVIYTLGLNYAQAGALLADPKQRVGDGIGPVRDYVEAALREEIIHFAQYEAIRQRWEAGGKQGAFAEAVRGHYAGLWKLLDAEQQKAARRLYADEGLADWAIAAEHVRQLVQLAKEGKTTETVTQWLQRHFADVMAVLRKVLANRAAWSPMLEQTVKETEAVLAGVESAPTSKVETKLSPSSALYKNLFRAVANGATDETLTETFGLNIERVREIVKPWRELQPKISAEAKGGAAVRESTAEPSASPAKAGPVLSENEQKAADAVRETFGDFLGASVPVDRRSFVERAEDVLSGLKRRTLRREGGYAEDFSKSNRAMQAEDNGRFPASRIAEILKVPVAFVKEEAPKSGEWHHSSKFYNRTDYYDLDAVAEWLDGVGDYSVTGEEATGGDRLAEWRMKEKQRKGEAPDILRGRNVKVLEWSGTASHRRASEVVHKNVTITRKPGQKMVTVLLPDGSEFKKGLETTGFEIADGAKWQAASWYFDTETSRIKNTLDYPGLPDGMSVRRWSDNEYGVVDARGKIAMGQQSFGRSPSEAAMRFDALSKGWTVEGAKDPMVRGYFAAKDNYEAAREQVQRGRYPSLTDGSLSQEQWSDGFQEWSARLKSAKDEASHKLSEFSEADVKDAIEEDMARFLGKEEALSMAENHSDVRGSGQADLATSKTGLGLKIDPSAPTRAEDVRIADRATEATSLSNREQTTLRGEERKENLGDFLGASVPSERDYAMALPADRGKVQGLVAKLVDELSVTSPEGLARVLSSLGDKAVGLSQKLWQVTHAFGAEGDLQPDWGKIYESQSGNETGNEAAPNGGPTGVQPVQKAEGAVQLPTAVGGNEAGKIGNETETKGQNGKREAVSGNEMETKPRRTFRRGSPDAFGTSQTPLAQFIIESVGGLLSKSASEQKKWEGQYDDFREAQQTAAAEGEAATVPTDLSVGDTVEVDGEHMVVKEIDPDTGDVTLQDGSRFGLQQVAGNDLVYGEVSRVAAPAKADAVARLRNGEKQGDIFSNASEDLNLAGETGVDFDRVAREKAEAEQAAAAAKAKQDREQQSLFDGGQKAASVSSGKASNSAAPAGISDFGEKIFGAKKDLWQSYQRAIAEELPADGADITISKSFPEPDYETAIANGVPVDALATVKALRDMIPPKPRMSYKLSRWVAQVRVVHGAMKDLLSGDFSLSTPNHRAMALLPYGDELITRANLYKDLGFPAFTKASDWQIRDGGTVFRKNGVALAVPERVTMASFKGRFSNSMQSPKEGREGYREVLDMVRAHLLAEIKSPKPKTEKPMEFNIYKDRLTSDLFIGKKAVNGVVRLKTGFKDVKEVRQYLADNRASLEEKWNGMKAHPEYRRAINLPRQGPQRREGDTTPELFQEAFGFRGVQFGNYVESDRRQVDLNEAFDGLMDMAEVLGIPAGAMSLDGSLALAFGARGRGGKGAAAAHYESGQVVINLTKGAGPGSLAHEWFHAFDNYFSRLDKTGGTEPNVHSGYSTEDAAYPKGIRTDVWQAFTGIRAVLVKGDFAKRSLELDQARSKPYYSMMIEKAARAFERYLVDRMAAKDIANDYLVNLAPNDDGDGGGAIPTKKEMEGGIKQAYDQLFNVLDTKQTEKGTMLFASLPMDLGQVGEEVDGILAETVPVVDVPAGKGGWMRDLYTRGIRGWKDVLDHFAPGTKDALEDHEMDSAKVRAGIREMMERMLGNIRETLGKARDAGGVLLRKRFVAELLPVAARLNPVGYDSQGDFVFGDFEMRAGSLALKEAEQSGVTTGDVVERRGEFLRVGQYLEDQKAYQLLRSMDAARQAALYQDFMGRYPATGHYLNLWIKPDGASERVTDERGTVLPEFNRHALREFFGEVSPHGDLGTVEGYVPEVMRTRSLAGALAGAVSNLLNKNWKSGAREWKTGEAREKGNVKDLFAGFSIRAMEAHAEDSRMKLAEKLLPLAVKPIPPTGMPDGYVNIKDAMEKLAGAQGAASGLTQEQLIAFTKAIVAEDMDALKKLVGAAWAKVRGRQMIRKEVFAELVRPLVDKRVRNTFVKVVDSMSKSYTAGLLSSPFSWIQNQLSNELFKMMRAAQRASYGAMMTAEGWRTGNAREQREGRLALKESWNLTKGMVTARWWNQAAIDAVVAPEYFEGDTGISGAAQNLTEESMTAMDFLKQANVPQAILQGVGYGKMDVRAKQQLAYASFVAQATVALEDAEAKGFKFANKAQRVAWMKNWLNHEAGPEVRRRATAVAKAYAMDYTNVPWWLDDGHSPAWWNVLRRLMLPFSKWPYNMARQMKRFGVESAGNFTLYVAGKMRVPTMAGKASAKGVSTFNPKVGEAAAHIVTFGMLYMVARAMVSASRDKDEADGLGRSFDEEGNRLDGQFNTSSRVRLGGVFEKPVRALAKMFGDEKQGDDYWLRVRTLPYASPLLALAATMDWVFAGKKSAPGRGAEAMDAWSSFVEDYNSEGILQTVMNKARGIDNKYTASQPISTVLGGAMTDFATARLVPPPLMSMARDLVDPVGRRLNRSKDLDFNQSGPLEGLAVGAASRLPWLSRVLPPRGEVKTKLLTNAIPEVGRLQAEGLKNAYKLNVSKTGKPEASFVDPEELARTPRWKTLLRLAGMNVKPVDRAGYGRAVTGKETEYRKLLRKANGGH